MKRIELLLGATALALAASSLAAAFTAPPSTPVFASQEKEGPMVPHMKVLNGGQRALKRLIVDPKANEKALLEQIGAMQSAALAILALSPPQAGVEIEGDRRAWVNAFRRSMAEVYVLTLELERATLAGDATALGAGYERLGALKKSGHDTFRG